MLFNSLSFIFVFAPIVYGLYWQAKTTRARKAICLGASYIFYGVWDVWFAVLMLATTSVDYFTAQRIEDADSPKVRRFWLIVSMVVNLGVLAVFKYLDFFTGSINEVFGTDVPLLRLVLPIGISFYTFESMSYTIDVYRREIPALRSFLDYGHFVTMFPRLVAGPIARYRDLAQQLRVLPTSLPADRVALAVHFFALGFAKKLLIADPIASDIVDPLFKDAGSTEFFGAWLAALGYTAQLYFDFSGYSDMAVGLGHLLGIELPRNFNKPYAAVNLSDFWRRWHISLSTWLRDYLYIPLGGNRQGPTRTKINLFLTMLLGGLWHGANWTFVIWGALHGVGLVVQNVLGPKMPPVLKRISPAMTFVFVVFCWVMFRAASVGEASALYAGMLGVRGFDPSVIMSCGMSALVLVLALVIAPKFDTYDLKTTTSRKWALSFAAIMLWCILKLDQPSPFLYFQF